MAHKEQLHYLYGHLIDARKDDWQAWHDGYRDRCEEVAAVRTRLKAGDRLSERHDEAFLRGLLHAKENGIAPWGPTGQSEDAFRVLIGDAGFRASLEALILTPDRDCYRNFHGVWGRVCREAGLRRNPVLVNRTAVACSPDLSAMVAEGKFWDVFNGLLRDRVIAAYSGEPDWYSANRHLTGQITEAFRERLETGETDRYYLSIFVWALYKRIVATL